MNDAGQAPGELASERRLGSSPRAPPGPLSLPKPAGPCCCCCCCCCCGCSWEPCPCCPCLNCRHARKNQQACGLLSAQGASVSGENRLGGVILLKQNRCCCCCYGPCLNCSHTPCAGELTPRHCERVLSDTRLKISTGPLSLLRPAGRSCCCCCCEPCCCLHCSHGQTSKLAVSGLLTPYTNGLQTLTDGTLAPPAG